MKISKLFHWLYALIMFLPVFFWIPTAFYYGFNEHATNSSTTDVQINYIYQTNDVNSVDDLVEGNLYFYEAVSFNISTETNFVDVPFKTIKYDSVSYVFNDTSYGTARVNFPSQLNVNDYYITFRIYSDGDDFYFSVGDLLFDDDDGYLNFTNVCFVYDDEFAPLFDHIDLPIVSPFNVIESVDVIETGGISNAMYKSWQDVWSLPMFSWTHDTFFSAPFNYIAGLFGIQAGNTLSYCLSYWFSISIIWLVFDLMIYVPLLVHRWLDKAAIE